MNKLIIIIKLSIKKDKEKFCLLHKWTLYYYDSPITSINWWPCDECWVHAIIEHYLTSDCKINKWQTLGEKFDISITYGHKSFSFIQKANENSSLWFISWDDKKFFDGFFSGKTKYLGLADVCNIIKDYCGYNNINTKFIARSNIKYLYYSPADEHIDV